MAAIVSPIDDGSAAPQRSEGNQPTRRLDGDFDRALNDASLGLLSAGDNEISEDDKLVGELARLAAGNDPVKALEIVSARLAVRREAVSSEKKWALAMMLCVTVLAVAVGYLLNALAVEVAAQPVHGYFPYFLPEGHEYLVTMIVLAAALTLTGPGLYGFDAGRGWARRPFIGSILCLLLGIGAGVGAWLLLNGSNPLH